MACYRDIHHYITFFLCTEEDYAIYQQFMRAIPKFNLHMNKFYNNANRCYFSYDEKENRINISTRSYGRNGKHISPASELLVFHCIIYMSPCSEGVNGSFY
jgi:hypothetical protein